MLTRKPAQIEGWLTATWPPAPRIDVFPPGVQPAPGPEGALVPREQLARVPVPEGFDIANLSTINKGGGRRGSVELLWHPRHARRRRQFFARREKPPPSEQARWARTGEQKSRGPYGQEM